MKLLVIIFGVLVLWIGYSQFFKPDPLACNEELKRLPQAMEKHNPDIVILCHGCNDILRRLILRLRAFLLE